MLRIKEGVEAVRGWFDSQYCAVTSIKGIVRLYSIAERSFVAEFPTMDDAGGISVAMSSDDRYCFLGTYYAWGLACFEVSTGKLVWKRKDLTRFYGLSFSAGQQTLFGYFHGKSALKIDPSTGETLQSFRGIQEVSPAQSMEIRSARTRRSCRCMGRMAKGCGPLNAKVSGF